MTSFRFFPTSANPEKTLAQVAELKAKKAAQ